jgi:hypothetical protein
MNREPPHPWPGTFRPEQPVSQFVELLAGPGIDQSRKFGRVAG